MPTVEDSLFEEFLEKFKTIIAEEFPSLDGYEFEKSKLRRLFDHFLTIIIVANVGITPTIGQMLAVLKLDPEEEYELQGDEGFQRHLAYPLLQERERFLVVGTNLTADPCHLGDRKASLAVHFQARRLGDRPVGPSLRDVATACTTCDQPTQQEHGNDTHLPTG